MLSIIKWPDGLARFTALWCGRWQRTACAVAPARELGGGSRWAEVLGALAEPVSNIPNHRSDEHLRSDNFQRQNIEVSYIFTTAKQFALFRDLYYGVHEERGTTTEAYANACRCFCATTSPPQTKEGAQS